MLYCKNCQISLPGDPCLCPLCHTAPRGEPSGEGISLPRLPDTSAPSRSLLALLAFITVSLSAFSISINLMFPQGGWWFLFVLAGLGSLWLSFGILLKKRKNMPKEILWQVSIISLLSLLWDAFSGWRGWSLNYVVPILYTCAMIALAVLARVKNMHIQDYILYLLLSCVLGIVSLILVVVDVVDVVIPSLICFACSIVFLAELLFFEGRALWAEIQRRLHL